MGISLKDIFKEDEEKLVMNRSNKAIKTLIFMATAVVFAIIIAVIIKFSGDKDEERRINITEDIKIVQDAVRVKATEYKKNPTSVSLIGTSLENTPQQLNVNGVIEEYRYGYYMVTPEALATLTKALNLPQEYYIVNYDTYDVVNFTGVVHNKMRYHSIEDILLVDANSVPAKKEIIRTAADLEKIRANPNGYFKLSGNLDLSAYSTGEGWKPIEQFGGTLDGRGYTISNLTIHRPSSNNVGLFGMITGTANITNVKFENVSVTGGQYVGALAGSSAGNVSHVLVNSGNVSGQTYYTGGLVGSQNNGSISNCIVKLKSVIGSQAVGGIAGMVYSGTIDQCKAETSLTGKDCVGGIIGNASMNSEKSAIYVKQVAANVQIVGSTDLGGIIGKVEALSDSVFDLSDSYSKGVIRGTHKNAGGFVGSVSSVGVAKIGFKSSYTTLDILEKAITSGGCVGYSNIAITSAVSFSDCFWEKDLAPGEELRSVGAKNANTFTLSFDDKDYNEMRIRNTFANWDLVKIWKLDERNSTPYLLWEI